MKGSAEDLYGGFLRQFANDAGLLDAAVALGGNAVCGLGYQAWSQSLPEHARRASTGAEIWVAGATAMFQALVERGYIVPHEVESALQATADVLTT
jgi:hypothetical protein